MRWGASFESTVAKYKIKSTVRCLPLITGSPQLTLAFRAARTGLLENDSLILNRPLMGGTATMKHYPESEIFMNEVEIKTAKSKYSTLLAGQSFERRLCTVWTLLPGIGSKRYDLINESNEELKKRARSWLSDVHNVIAPVTTQAADSFGLAVLQLCYELLLIHWVTNKSWNPKLNHVFMRNI